MKVDLGCGHTKKDGYVGVDLIPEADIQKDMLEYLKSMSENSIDAIRAFHSFEHLTKEEFLNVMNEILRVCKNGSLLEIGVPYYTQSVNIANPFHHIGVSD